jgi:hypothetical protein
MFRSAPAGCGKRSNRIKALLKLKRIISLQLKTENKPYNSKKAVPNVLEQPISTVQASALLNVEQ